MKILTTVLLLGLVHFASAQEAPAPAPPPPTGRLALDQPPKFSTLTDASFRFRNPHQGLSSWRNLEGEPASIILSLAGKETPPLKVSRVGVEFLQQDIAQPGPYYPPTLPVGPGTPVRRLGFTAEIPPEEIKPVIGSLFPMLKLDQTKVMVWAENELWKFGSGLEMQGELPGGATARVYLSRGAESETYSLSLTFTWLKEEQDSQRRPRAAPQPRRVPQEPQPNR